MTYANGGNNPTEDPHQRNLKNDNKILKQHSLKV